MSLVRPRSAVRALVLLIAVVPGTAAAAQELPPAGVPLTLEQVLQLGEARSESIAIARTAIRRAEGDQVRSRSALFPQLSFTGSYDRALASEFSNLFSGTSPFGTGASTGNGSSTESDQSTTDAIRDLPFGRTNTWRATLTFSQNVYSGGRIGLQQRVSALGREAAAHGLTTARAQALLDITQAYYDAVLSARMVSIAQATLEQASATLQQTQTGFSAGTQPEFEVLRARVTRDNQSPILIRQRANQEVAMLRLKQLLDLPSTYDLRLADALTEDQLPPPPVFASRVAAVETAIAATPETATIPAGLPLPARTVVTDAETTVRSREAALKLAEAQKHPSVSVNSTYSRVGYPTDAIPVLDRTNWTIGASVQLPILTGGRQRGDELVARADLDQSRAQLQQTQELADLDTRSAWAELAAARSAWAATAGTIQQADRAYRIAEVRYQSGVSTQLELSDSRLLLQQAEANRAQAARDLQVARARVALLPDLPLAGGASSTPGRPAQPAAQPQQTSPTPAPNQQPQGGTQLANTGATSFTTGTR